MLPAWEICPLRTAHARRRLPRARRGDARARHTAADVATTPGLVIPSWRLVAPCTRVVHGLSGHRLRARLVLESPPVEACLGLQPPARRSRYRRDGRDLATDLATDPVVRDPRDTVVIRCRPRTILSLSEQRNSTTHTFRIANEAMRYESSCNTPCNTIRAVGVGGNNVTSISRRLGARISPLYASICPKDHRHNDGQPARYGQRPQRGGAEPPASTCACPCWA